MSQKYQVQYSPSALSDLRNTYSYIAFHLKEVRTAKNQVRRIRNAIADLSSFLLVIPPSCGNHGMEKDCTNCQWTDMSFTTLSTTKNTW